MRQHVKWFWVAWAVCALIGGARYSVAQDIPSFRHELWGHSTAGEGYVYGVERSSNFAVTDYDSDNDQDFVLFEILDRPQIMRNLGTAQAFYPGGPLSMNIEVPDEIDVEEYFIQGGYDFGDLTGDGLRDFVAVVFREDTGQNSLVWYKNQGPRHNPVYMWQEIIRSFPVEAFIAATNLADIDGDGDKDLFALELVLDGSPRPHRILYLENKGTPSQPSFATPIEVTALSQLLPPAFSTKSKELQEKAEHFFGRNFARSAKQGSNLSPRVSDFELSDRDFDGVLDFLYYDADHGIDWIKNTGSASEPAWGDSINPDGVYVYNHQAAGFPGIEFGGFGVRPSPLLTALTQDYHPSDLFVAVKGILQTWRFNLQYHQYELIQTNTISLRYGMGAPVFWDYDSDGDQDWFQLIQAPNGPSGMQLIENEGKPYAPVWGRGYGLIGASVDTGSSANGFREQPYAMANSFIGYTSYTTIGQDLYPEFYVQTDGGVQLYWITLEWDSSQSAFLPRFHIDTNNYDTGFIAENLLTGESGVEPRGLAVADFWTANNTGPFGSQVIANEIVAAYKTDDGGLLALARLEYNSSNGQWNWYTHDLSSQMEGPGGGDFNPNAVADVASADLNQDGSPDLIVAFETSSAPLTSRYHLYWNASTEGGVAFTYGGEIEEPFERDFNAAGYTGFVDIDSDSDMDLFVAHKPLATDGSQVVAAYPRFYRNTADNGLESANFRVVAEQEWTFTIGETTPSLAFLWNNSGGSILGEGRYRAGSGSGVVDIVQTTNHTPAWRLFIDVLPPVGPESKAIIVAGGDPADSLYPVFLGLAAFAGESILLQGLDKSNVRVFASGAVDIDRDGSSDTFAAPSLSGLQQSILNWASDTERLVVYLVDHGQLDAFRVNETEYLAADTYAGWLDSLQGGNQPPQVTTIIDTCESASFFDELATQKGAAKAGVERITITSANQGPIEGVALFDQQTWMSFSLAFWEEIRVGRTYGQAFDTAKVAIEAINPLQVPQIDDNGNGTPNEQNDGLLAKDARPGSEFGALNTGVFVGEVAPHQVISASEASLWIGEIVANFPPDEAGAVVIPPNLTRGSRAGDDDEQPLTGMEWVELEEDPETGRWENTFGQFTVGGLYKILYFVKSGGRYHASPRIGLVDRVGIPDAYEPDDTAASAGWLPINLAQGHNFHVANDTDWLRFFAPDDQEATIAIVAPGPNAQPVVELYKKAALEENPGSAPMVTEIAPAPGGGFSFTQSFGDAGEYLLRIRNSDGSLYGEGTSYTVIVAVGTGGQLFPSDLAVTVLDLASSVPLEEATVVASAPGSTFRSTTDETGVARITSTTNTTYMVEVSKEGYEPSTQSITVNNHVEPLTVQLRSEDSDPFDINGDNKVNALDIQLVINGALGIDTGYNDYTDVNKDGSTNALDIQSVINAVLGIT